MFRVSYLAFAASAAASTVSVSWVTYPDDQCATAEETQQDINALVIFDENGFAADGSNAMTIPDGTETGQRSTDYKALNKVDLGTCYSDGTDSVKFVRTDMGKLVKKGCSIASHHFADNTECADSVTPTATADVGKTCTDASGLGTVTAGYFQAVCSEDAAEEGTADFKLYDYDTSATCESLGSTQTAGLSELFNISGAIAGCGGELCPGFSAASLQTSFQVDVCYTIAGADGSMKFVHGGCDETDGKLTHEMYDEADCSGTAASTNDYKFANHADACQKGSHDGADQYYKIGSTADDGATKCPPKPGNKFAAKHFSVVAALIAGVLVQLL